MPQIPLTHSSFTLDAGGIAGLFGGDEAISAMATVHIYEGRKWLGWYNSPGSYTVSKRYGQLANSRFWDSFYPGVTVDPTTLFELGGMAGPRFIASRSGTSFPQTSHAGYLFWTKCQRLPVSTEVEGRRSKTCTATIAKLDRSSIKDEEHPVSLRGYTSLMASFPIGISIASCAACGVFQEWYSFSMILLGILVNGLSCFVIGSGKLMFRHPNPAPNAPPGDGLLVGDQDVVAVIGEEGIVNSVTRGEFALVFAGEPKYNKIGWSAMLLTVQFLAQLLLLPQALLFGQLMFLASLGASWAYNSYLSSFDKEEIQIKMLDKIVYGPDPRKYTFGTRTAMVVFVVLVLAPPELQARQMLNGLLPSATPVWRKWQDQIVAGLKHRESFPQVITKYLEDDDWEDSDVKLLQTLLQDACDGFRAYELYRKS